MAKPILLGPPHTVEHAGLASGEVLSLLQVVEVFKFDQIFRGLQLCQVAMDRCRADAAGSSDQLLPHLRALQEHLNGLGAGLIGPGLLQSRKFAGRMAGAILPVMAHPDPGSQIQSVEQLYLSLQMLLYSELEEILFLAIDPQDKLLFKLNHPHFGDGVARVFKDARLDIAEASKCLGLGRGTACACHLMRALEVVLKKLARRTGAKAKHDWGAILKEIKVAIDKKLAHYTASPNARAAVRSRVRKEHAKWSEVAERFERIREAFRNPVMHGPRQVQEPEARVMYDATKEFMSYLVRQWPAPRKKS